MLGILWAGLGNEGRGSRGKQKTFAGDTGKSLPGIAAERYFRGSEAAHLTAVSWSAFLHAIPRPTFSKKALQISSAAGVSRTPAALLWEETGGDLDPGQLNGKSRRPLLGMLSAH
jgi:hypothetical protein